MDNATQVLTQFVVVSLLVERIVTVCAKVVLRGPKPTLGKFSEEPDPWLSWTKWQVICAALVGLAVCALYDLDLFSSLLARTSAGPGMAAAAASAVAAASASASLPASSQSVTVAQNWPIIGQVLTAIVIAGGSAGLQKMLSSISALAKANKAEAFRRVKAAEG